MSEQTCVTKTDVQPMVVGVTGGTGFVGKQLVKDLLHAGYDVRVLTRQAIDSDESPAVMYRGSLENMQSLLRFLDGVDVICHCAGEITQEHLFIPTNLEGTKSLFTASVACGIKRFVHLSSVGVYGQLDRGIISESQALNPMNPYEASKIAADRWLLDQHDHNIEVTLIRPSSIIGPDMSNGSLKQLISTIKRRMFVLIGSGNLASYVSVDNVSQAIIDLVKYPKNLHQQIYHISESLSWKELRDIVCETLGVRRRHLAFPTWMARIISRVGEACFKQRFPLTTSRVLALSKKTVYDSSRIAQDIGYEPINTVSQSIIDCAEHWFVQGRVESSQPLRIVRVATVPEFMAMHLRHQIQYITSHNVNMTLLTSPGSLSDVFTWSDSLQYHPIAIRRNIRLIDDFISLVKLIRYFRKKSFDIIHSSTPKAGLLCAMASLFCRQSCFIHTFTGQVWATRRGVMRVWLKWCDKFIINRALKTYADSHSQVQFLVDNQVIKFSSQVSVLGAGSLSGVDLTRFDINQRPLWRRTIRSQLGLADSDFVFLFVGRVHRDKGVMEMLEAYRLAFLGNPSVHLVVCGPMELSMDLQVSFEECVSKYDGVYYIGSVNSPEHYYAASDVLMLPSFREGFGLAVIEAASMAVPTIATDIPGLSDAIVHQETGHLVPIQSVIDLSRQMTIYFNHPDQTRVIGERAYQRALSHFSSHIVSSLQLREYQRLLRFARGTDKCREK